MAIELSQQQARHAPCGTEQRGQVQGRGRCDQQQEQEAAGRPSQLHRWARLGQRRDSASEPCTVVPCAAIAREWHGRALTRGAWCKCMMGEKHCGSMVHPTSVQSLRVSLVNTLISEPFVVESHRQGICTGSAQFRCRRTCVLQPLLKQPVRHGFTPRARCWRLWFPR